MFRLRGSDLMLKKSSALRWTLTLLGSALLVIGAALSAPAAAADGDWPHAASDLQPDPDIHYGRLDNGFRYVLMPNTEPKGRVSMHLNVQAGSLHERDDQRGLAHFLEHMLFCGSENFAPGTLVKYFQEIGMKFGPDANAHTGFDETVYDILLPDGGEESLASGLKVLDDYARGALLLASEVDRERKVVLSEKRVRDSASYRIFDACMQFEFEGTLIPDALPIGREEVLQAADREALKAFYDAWYRPETMILVMVGDFDPQTATALVTRHFASLTARAPRRAAPVVGKVAHQGLKSFYHYEAEAGKTEVRLEVIADRPPEGDSKDALWRRTVLNLADRVLQNRLDRLVRSGEAPVTSAGIGSGVFLERVRYAELSAECEPAQWEAALNFLEQTLRQALVFGFSAAEVERVKKDFLAELDTAVAKAGTRESQALARQIIRYLNSDRVLQAPRQRRDLLQPLVAALTPAALHEAFKANWQVDHRLVLVAGNARIDNGERSPGEILTAAYRNSAAIEVAAPAADRQVAFPYLPRPPQPGTISARTSLADLGVVQVDFVNGFRLNLKTTDFKADEVKATLAFGQGQRSQPTELPGLAQVSEATVNESGLGALTKDELEQALAGRNTQVSFSVDEDRFTFRGVTVRKEVGLLVDLLYAHVRDAAFDAEAFRLSLERLKQEYEAYSRSVQGGMHLEGLRFLAGGDNRFGFPTDSELRGLTRDDVQRWVGTALDSAPLELSLVGDFDADAVVKLAGATFGALPPRTAGPAPPARPEPRFPVGAALDVPVASEIPKGLVVVAYATEDSWQIQRTRRLAMLGEVISDRLRIAIRETLGASYSPFAYNRPSRAYAGYGLLQVYVPTDPGEAAKVVAEVKRIMADLAINGITEEELQRALKPVLTGLKDLRRTNDYWLYNVLTDARRHPQQLDWSRSIETDYAAITAQELARLARRYLQNDRATVVTVYPATPS